MNDLKEIRSRDAACDVLGDGRVVTSMEFDTVEQVVADRRELIGLVDELRELVYDAYGVMATHEARHTKRADRRRNELDTHYHSEKAAHSGRWLERAGPIYNELYAQRAEANARAALRKVTGETNVHD